MARHAEGEHAHLAASARWLEAVCLGFAALGVLLPFAYASPLLAPYRAAVGAAIGDPAVAEGGPTLRLVLGITGGSIAGKWVLHWAVVRYGVRARRRWARDATLAGLASWLVLDSWSSLVAGAWANVVMINGMPPLLVIPALARIWRLCDRAPAPPAAAHARPATLALAAAVVAAATGPVIALGMETGAFDAWRAGLSAAHFEGAPLPAPARALVRFFAGPIGGATLGQFVLAAFVARYAMPAGERWAAALTLVSVLVWAGIDTLASVASGATFNVLLVNLPCLALVAPPLAWAIARARAPSARGG